MNSSKDSEPKSRGGAKSAKAKAQGKEHFVLVKRQCFGAKGEKYSARAAALKLLELGLWPLWEKTPNRGAFKAGNRLAIYLSGNGDGQVVATATVASVGKWTRDIAISYPLALDGTPFCVLHLDSVKVLDKPIAVKDRLAQLSFIPSPESKKWGVAFMGGTRALSPADYAVLTTAPTISTSQANG